MPTGLKFIGGPELAVTLWFKAMCYSALSLSDGFVPDETMYGLTKARRRDVDKALEHMASVQPGCQNPSLHKRPGGWLLHDYDDPIYANPMRDGVQALQLQRQNSAKAAGKASAAARTQKYGTAQPVRVQPPNDSPNDSFEPPFENRSTENAPSTERLTERPSRTTPNGPALRSTATSPDVSETDHLTTRHGDDATLGGSNGAPAPGSKVLVGRLLDWLCFKHGWSTINRDTFLREESVAKQIAALGSQWTQLHVQLDAMWEETDPDDRPSTLGYFWTRLQDQQHASTKQPRSHVRTDGGSTKLEVSVKRGGSHKEVSE